MQVCVCVNSLYSLTNTACRLMALICMGQGLVSKYLTELSLNSNNLGDHGCAALAKALASSPALKRLDLSGNSIGNIGGADVAKALVTNSTLTSLSLENNCIADHAGVGIAQALSHNHALLSLSLKANLLRDTTGEALVVGLRTNDTLTELDVSWNDINYTNHQSLEALIQEQANRYRDASVARDLNSSACAGWSLGSPSVKLSSGTLLLSEGHALPGCACSAGNWLYKLAKVTAK